MTKHIEFYFSEEDRKLAIVAIEVQGIKHFTADIRTWRPEHIEIVTSASTKPGLYEQKDIDRWLEAGVWVKKELEVEVEEYKDHYTTYVVKKELLKDIL